MLPIWDDTSFTACNSKEQLYLIISLPAHVQLQLPHELVGNVISCVMQRPSLITSVPQ